MGEQDGVDYLVTEYIEGETLAERLTKGALTLDETLRLGTQIAEGLDAAHQAGIVHRDVKVEATGSTRSGSSAAPTLDKIPRIAVVVKPAAAMRSKK